VAVITLTNKDWSRHHDPRTTPIRPNVARITCFDTVEDLINICKARPAATRFKGSGSHWGLSEAALSDHDAIETNWPGPEPVPRHSGPEFDLAELHSDQLFHFLMSNPPGKAETLTNDPCLQRPAAGPFYVHIKSGTRVYEAYTFLDQSTAPANSFGAKLNKALAGTPAAGAYNGPWAFATLGGAGGQTVFGALTTGTHGGDYRQQPISDSVVAVHLVTDGGDHYWIEPNDFRNEIVLTDDNKLRNRYGNIAGTRFSIIRDSAIFDAAVISGGRFGVIASLVLRAVPQYCLHEHRVLENWSHVKQLLMTPMKQHHVFDPVFFPDGPAAEAAFISRFGPFLPIENRFLQIAVNTCPHNINEHRVGVTQRWFASHSSPEAKDPDGTMRGRDERGTPETAGKSFPYEPTEDPSKSGSSSGTFLQKACANGNFIAGVLNEAADAIQEVIDDGFVPATSIVALASGLGPAGLINPITDICLILKLLVELLRELADDFEASGDVSLTQVVNGTIESIMNNPDIPRPVAIMTIRMIFLMIFESQQSKRDFVALSYAVMDTHDYKDRSCFGNAESIEVFFDAKRPDVYCSYVDQILAFEAAQQQNEGKFTAGYVSLRYVRASQGLIAPSRFDETLVIEVAAIRDAAGSVPFVMNAAQVARHPMFAAPFHWGQFNPLVRSEVDRIFDAAPKTGALTAWRNALRLFTQNGRLNGFSSNFTRRAGLEL
jgi:hypothetical protein